MCKNCNLERLVKGAKNTAKTLKKIDKKLQKLK
jgi:hypothetical protein